MGRPLTNGGGRWRMAAWGGAAALLLLPLGAMQVTDQVAWTPSDFALAGALLGGAGLVFELAARMTGGGAQRAALGVAVGTAVLLVWANGAVGLIGSEDDPANRMYGGVLAVGLVGALLARLRPWGMARAMAATALAQGLVAGIALGAGLGGPASPPVEVLGVNGLFAALWLLSAALFRRAARDGDVGRGSAS